MNSELLFLYFFLFQLFSVISIFMYHKLCYLFWYLSQQLLWLSIATTLLHICSYCDSYQHTEIWHFFKLVGQWQWMSSRLAGQFMSTMCSTTHLKPTLLCAHLFLNDACEYLPCVPVEEIFKRLVQSPVANGRTKRSILYWIQNKRCYLWNKKTCFDDTKSRESQG